MQIFVVVNSKVHWTGMRLCNACEFRLNAKPTLRGLVIEAHERTIGHCNRWLVHIENRLTYERAMLADAGGTVADRGAPQKGGGCKCWASPRGGWSYIQKVNKLSVTVLDGNGGGDFTRTIPLDKLSGVMSAAEVQEARESGRLARSQFAAELFLDRDTKGICGTSLARPVGGGSRFGGVPTLLISRGEATVRI